MIRSLLVATVRTNGQQSENFICIDSGMSVRLENIREMVEGMGGYFEPQEHQTIGKFTNYQICFPDYESYNTYLTYCKLVG